jgi:hypothetical protein
VISRSTLRRTAKSHSLCVLPRSTRVVFPFSGRLPLTVPSKSFTPNLFADPHHLTRVPSIFYKNLAGLGYPLPEPPLATHHSPLHSSPFFSIALRTLLHFSALAKTQPFSFQGVAHSLPKMRGCGCSQRSNVQLSNLQTIPSSHCSQPPLVPQSAKARSSRWRRETYSPQPVSKMIERTSGTVRAWSPLQVVPGSSVLMLDRSRVARSTASGKDAGKQRVGKAGSVRLG